MTDPGSIHVPAGLLVLLAAITAERLLELVVAKRNARWAAARGGVEYGRGHYPVMVVLHVGLIAGTLAEVALVPREFTPAVGWPALTAVVLANVVRGWCMHALGPQWNTRVIVVPGMPLVTTGPYRWTRHPNYLIVILEGFALPLVYSAWITATLFTVADAALLSVRMRVENRVLRPAT
ncbi:MULTISPECIES: isoprenylcysteine carboxyl methyltransferase family protein [unclassified Streptomyces]|uniref:isoprenylcysteine carboxyl methyltransferase family protein n=1 Tax=unclassified Streptomyces TaxID=2593676 RepID=UPI00278BB674|nr:MULTISPECIES: isoprenylcysteine carboxylmethyltransferase family protein [unclassified Streptomyces]